MRLSWAVVGLHWLGLSLPGLEWIASARADTYESALLDGVTVRDRAVQTGNIDDWRRVVAHLDRALDDRVSAEALFERAGALAALDRIADAANDYERALELGLSARAAEHARRYVTEHEADLGRLLLRGPAGAAASIAGRRPVPLPLVSPVLVAAGSVAVRADIPNFLPWLAIIPVPSRTVVSRDVPLIPVRAFAHPAVRSLDSGASWDRAVRVGGTAVAAAGGLTALVSTLLLPDARRRLAASCLDLTGDRCQRAVVANRQDAQAAADRLETLKASRWIGAGALLGGALALGLGTLFAAHAKPQAPVFQIGWGPYGDGVQLSASVRGQL